MTAVAALITLEPPAVDEAMIMAIATWATEPIRPASLLQSSLTLLLAAEEPLELKQGKAFLDRMALRMALRDTIRLVCVYHSVHPARSARSHLGNQDKDYRNR